MRRVLKYPVLLGEGGTIDHKLIRICHVDRQGPNICLWALVESEIEECREVVVLGTGHAVPDGYEFAGTLQTPPYVWHVFYNPVPVK